VEQGSAPAHQQPDVQGGSARAAGARRAAGPASTAGRTHERRAARRLAEPAGVDGGAGGQRAGPRAGVAAGTPHPWGERQPGGRRFGLPCDAHGPRGAGRLGHPRAGLAGRDGWAGAVQGRLYRRTSGAVLGLRPGLRDETQDTENLAKEPIDTNKGDSGSGFVIRLYQDGSFTITDKRNGQREVWGKDGHPATSSPKWTSNKTPVPDGEGGSRSGAVTRDEWRTLLGMIGARGGRLEKESGTAAGGIKAPTTTTAGTPVDHDRAVTVDLVQVQEIIRLSVEKLGPKLN
jgi:hypothetical protein